MTRAKTALLGGVVALCLAFPAWSKSADDLGKTLTPFGAVRAGNADGSIPEWTGGITAPPPTYVKGTHHPDPFPDDKVLFTITAQNMDQYADKLPEGLKAMLRAYPDTYRLPVYPSRRTTSAPQFVYDETKANATRAKLADGGNGVTGAKIGIPFPLAETGIEMVWNHLLRWRGVAGEGVIGVANPQADGAYTLIKVKQAVDFVYASENGPDGNTSIYFLEEILSPARLAGEMLLVHDTINQVAEPRSAWTYNPGQRRVRRAPNVAYDNPGTASDGLRTSDQLDMFNGAPDRYEWTFLGTKEMYIPYNSYKMHSADVKYADLIKPRHIDQDLARYELHRVHVVEGKLRQGTSHIYARRVFYIDEDSWQIMVADHYDGRGELWRVGEMHAINYYEVPTFWQTVVTSYDLQSGRYWAFGLDNEDQVFSLDKRFTKADFSPDSLRRAGIR
ncbi:DUF1329 domain-containing protein [Rhodocista pekingensis]|uniref:DUF1329 domain-containing protein n=1 Tax=Rhodocista pekingensis TaxID=201185 RepID=A0ABW2KWY8_9PROT